MNCSTHTLACCLIGGQLLLGGCQSMSHVLSRRANPPKAAATAAVMPSSDRSYKDALASAQAMVESNPALWFGQVSATGSMCPYLGESSLVVLEPPNPDELKGKIGSLIAFTREGSLYIHALVSTNAKGAVVRGASSDTLELVPYDSISGTAAAVLYFDPKTAPRDRSGPPVLLAANPEDFPSSSGDLRIVGAHMLAGQPVTIFPIGPGSYRAVMHHEDVLQVDLGIPGGSESPTVQATLTASDALIGETVDFQIYSKEAPKDGHILLKTTFIK